MQTTAGGSIARGVGAPEKEAHTDACLNATRVAGSQAAGAGSAAPTLGVGPRLRTMEGLVVGATAATHSRDKLGETDSILGSVDGAQAAHETTTNFGGIDQVSVIFSLVTFR